MNAPSLRVALIGYSRAGAVIHAPLIDSVDGLVVDTIATSRPEAVGSRYDAVRIFPEAADAFADPAINLVVIATPNDTHLPFATSALRAGKHVVGGKPLALSSRDVGDLVALAERVGRTVTAFHNRRWDGDFLAVRRTIDDGLVGDLMLVEADWNRFRPAAPDAWRNRALPGAGLLWDLGSHMIDQALYLFGPPRRVHADVASQRSAALADDYFHLTLQYGQMRCILSASSVVAAPRPRFAVYGTKGVL
jgi:scyllo-inositol 2-dehydrogenase (NADP+)